MPHKAVLLDLENNTPTTPLLRDILEHYPNLYLFNCSGKFELALDDLTEFSGWVANGRVVVLTTPSAEYKEFEYAVVVGQLVALLQENTHIELISAMDSSYILLQQLHASNISANLIQINAEHTEHLLKHFKLPSIASIQKKPYLKMVKQYCDALGKMSGKPNTVLKLQNSISNVLQVVPEKAQHVVRMLINLKIVKTYDEQINFRKKVLKQWLQIDLAEDAAPMSTVRDLSQAIAQLDIELSKVNVVVQTPIQHAQQGLFKNFAKIDQVQWEVARKLRELKDNKPKDIYELRDLLEQMFPKADIRMLLKGLLENGYIYWNGHEVLYSHEMFLN